MFQPRGRSGSKLTIVYDAEGREIEAESRQDEEQNVKLDETIDLLLAAGYFRARIKGLSPFDKIVGGMTWCITTCNFDVEVDLLFQESSTIGQKIALVEKIVAVLPRMKCPYRIEPHQIQGMDFIHIYPVIQWLVKRAIETKEEMGDFNRLFSISQFNKQYKLPEDDMSAKEVSMDTLRNVKRIYGPRRKYKRLEPLTGADEGVRVQSTLLEYGRRHAVSSQQESEGQNKPAAEGHKGMTEVIDSAVREDERIQALMESMASTESQPTNLAASKIGSMVSMQSAEIKKVSEEYAQKQAVLEQAADKPGTPQHHKKLMSALRKQVDERRQKQAQLETEYQERKEEYQQLHEELAELESMDEQIAQEMAKLEKLENGENKVVLEKLRVLVAQNDVIKEREKQYKQKCKEELAELKAELQKLEADKGFTEEDEERNNEIERQYEADKSKLHKMRLAIAKKNREISSLQRKIDEVPSRAELSQYQRRFIELYNQVGATHKETKQFYTLYNTLDDSKSYLEKEISLLNSIYDNFLTGMSTQANKDQFLKQFEHIVDGIKSSKAKLEKQREVEKMKRDGLNDQYLDLLEKQRLYFKTVKEFREELRKNEILMAKVAEIEE
ncbi:coiled-coil domain-containing protein 93-like [Watersipora subatra]|uniref:coiled-coil domain-containing protein 93-like n=1 Tax=Watersipora subatra TaxID=2589382 RepID=UPI00355B28F3